MRSKDGETSNAVVDTLVRDLGPVRRARFARVFGLCVLAELVAVVLAIFAFGIRHDVASKLVDAPFVAALVSLAVGAAWCAAISVRLSLPGRAVDGRAPWLLSLPVVLAVAAVALLPGAGSGLGWRGLIAGCVSCVGITTASALVPWLISLLILRRLAPLNAVRVGLFAGLSAFLVGALVTELHCPNPSGTHVALAHFLPVVLLAVVTCVAAAAVLRTRPGRQCIATPRLRDRRRTSE